MLKPFVIRLVNAGASRTGDKEQAEKIVILNKCLYAGLLLFIPNLVYEISLRLPYTAIIDCCFLSVVIFALIINRYGYYLAARNIAITSANLVLLSGNFAEGTAAGNYIIYLPLIVLFSVLVKLKEEKKTVMLLLALTCLCIVLCFLACPYESTIQAIPPQVYKSMFRGNVALSFILIIVFTYLVSVITFEKERQMSLAREIAEESTRAKSMFLSNMSHELRTPLNGIIGTSNLLLQENYLAGQKEHLHVLKLSSEHMLTLVNDILDFNKMEAGKVELQQKQVNLFKLLGQTEALFSRQFEKKGVRFAVEKDVLLNTPVLTDDTRLNQVLNNLLSNALKFTHKGEVILSAAVKQMTSDVIQVAFAVKDTGIGIAPDKLLPIFESFTQADAKTTRQYGGTGLGLSISKKIAEAFNSHLLVESEPGKGSTFYFDISFKRNGSSKPYITEKRKTGFESLRGLHLLLAEDNAINMRVAKKFLESWDIRISEATNGLEAVQKSREEPFDLLLLDLEMPEMDGYTALAEIRKFNTAIPAIAFTAAMFPGINTHLEAKGFNDFVTKPFRPEELYTKIKRFSNLKL
jgi:signal transduction histidine kinase/CheY-like chemotaxis protein